MNERHGPLLVQATSRRDAARSQITLGALVITEVEYYVVEILFTHVVGKLCKQFVISHGESCRPLQIY